MLSHALHASFADNAELRASDRRVLRLEAQVATDVGEGGFQVRNLSRTGLMLDGATDVPVGSEIAVELPGGSVHRAEVVWADESLFGCRFHKQLTQAQLSAALLRSEPSAPATSAVPATHDEALSRLREHWAEDTSPEVASERSNELSPGVRLRIIGALGVAAWVVTAAIIWMVMV